MRDTNVNSELQHGTNVSLLPLKPFVNQNMFVYTLKERKKQLNLWLILESDVALLEATSK